MIYCSQLFLVFCITSFFNCKKEANKILHTIANTTINFQYRITIDRGSNETFRERLVVSNKEQGDVSYCENIQ